MIKKHKYAISSIDGRTRIDFDRRHICLSSLPKIDPIDANLATFSGSGQYGATVTARTYGTRDVQLDGYILTDTEMFRNMLEKIIAPTHDFYLIADDKYQLRVTATQTLELSNKFYLHNDQLMSFTIEGTAYSPFWETTANIKLAQPVHKSLFHWPHAFAPGKTVFGEISDFTYETVGNEGEVPCGATFDITSNSGTLVNPRIDCTDGTWFQLDSTIHAGETVRITTYYGQKNVENITTGQSWLPFIAIGSTFFQVPMFKVNYMLSFDAESTGVPSMDIDYKPLYASI